MMVKLVALGILIALMAMLLRSFGFRGAAAFALLGVAVILSVTAGELGELLSRMGLRDALTEGSVKYASAVAKVVGTGYLFGIAADVCTELGEGGIARAVTLGGRIEILLIAAPYFSEVLEMGRELIG